MGAKKPSTPTKQNNGSNSVANSKTSTNSFSGTAKSAQTKKVTAKSAASVALPKEKDSNDAKKQQPTAAATSNSKKTTKVVVAANNAKAIKKSTQIIVDPKKNNKSQDSGKRQAMANNSGGKSDVNKSNHVVASGREEVKLNCNNNSNDDNSNKAEKLSSPPPLSAMSTIAPATAQCDGTKRKLSEKESDKSKSSMASKKSNNKTDESGGGGAGGGGGGGGGKKTSADRQKSQSKVAKKGSKERKDNNKIKISNELKNLGIEMSKSNSSFDSIQEDLSSGMKTSICEMVKLKKARHHLSSNNASLTKGASQSSVDNSLVVAAAVEAPAAVDNKSSSKISKESTQEKVAKKIEPKSNSSSTVQSTEKEDKPTKSKANANTQSKPSETTPVKRKYAKKPKEQAAVANNKTDDTADGKSKEKKVVKKLSKQKSASCESIKLSSPKKLKSDGQAGGKATANGAAGAAAQEKRKYSKKPNNSADAPAEPANKNGGAISDVSNAADNGKKESEQKESARGKEKSTIKADTQQTIKNNESKKAPPPPPPPPTPPPSPPQSQQPPPSAPSQQKKLANETATKTQKSTKSSASAKDAKKAAPKREKSALSKKQRNNVNEERDPLKLSSSESESGSEREDSDSDMEISDDIFKKPPAKPQSQQPLRSKKLKQITVIKRSRVASLNAIAKVHCLYENEARTHFDHSKAIKKPVSVVVCSVSSDEEEDENGDDNDDDDEDGDDESDSKETETVSKRSLRTAPGLRAVGKHWEMDSLSSDIDSDSDVSQKRPAKEDAKAKSITKSAQAAKNQESKHQVSKQCDSKSSSKLKTQMKKSSKQTKASDESQRDSDKEIADKKLSMAARKKQKVAAAPKKSASVAKSKKKKKKLNGTIKRKKKTKDDDKGCDKNVVTKKRMASLNASAILAANYEIENYAAKHESSTTETSDSSENEDDEEANEKKMKIEPPTMKKEKKDVKMESAEEPRPKSTTNLVKIDTDVTITGVYVNSALVSSQETICKTLKYRTAYSVTEECVVSRPPTQEPPKSYTPLSALTNMRPPMQQLPDPCMTSSSEQYQPQMPHQPQPHMYDQHMGPMPPSSYQYGPPSHAHPMPSTSSAFYPPQQVHHRDPMGYYQPAGPLISPHLLPPPPSLEGDQTQSSQPTSGSTGENDPDVMITGGDIAPRPQPYRYGPHPTDFSRPLHPQQMHYPPTYPPYGYYGQPPPPPPPTDLCYPYYPPKYYPNSPYARRPYMAPGYYQPPPLDYRSQPQPVPQSAPQQIVPAAPTPQHIDPHYSNSPYGAYPGAYNGYSQTPPRNLQPPAYLDAHQYHSASCPCPMQSCQSKNVHTGTGPINKQAKGPVSASSNNGMAESSSTAVSCKIENNNNTLLSPSVLIKPENDNKMMPNGSGGLSIESNHIGASLQSMVPSSSVSASSSLSSSLYTSVKVLDTPELSLSPARGSTGIQQIPTVQHEAAVQPTENNNNSSNLNSDNVSLSLRKQARIGKSMERDRQQQNHASYSGYHSNSAATPASSASSSCATIASAATSAASNNISNNHLHLTQLHHHGAHHATIMMERNARALEMTHFKQEFTAATVKREREDVKLENVCDDAMDMDIEDLTSFRSSAPAASASAPASIKIERTEEAASGSERVEAPTNQKSADNERAVSVNLISESGDDECGIDYSIKRKHDDSDDVIELSDNNSTLEAPVMKRRKLLATPISTPKKSPPNSYKNLIKPNAFVSTPLAVSPALALPLVAPDTANSPPAENFVTKAKVIAPAIASRSASKPKRSKSIIKSKSTFKTIGFAIKARKRALLKRKTLQQQQQQNQQQQQKTKKKKKAQLKTAEAKKRSERQTKEEREEEEEVKKSDDKLSSAVNNDDNDSNGESSGKLIEDDNDNFSTEHFEDEDVEEREEEEDEEEEDVDRFDDMCERVSNETSENNEEKSMDGSSECSGKSNIDLTIDRVAKGYFSESDVFSSLSKHRKTKSQKRFKAKLLDLCAKKKKKALESHKTLPDVPAEKSKKKNSKVGNGKKENGHLEPSSLECDMPKSGGKKEKTLTKATKKTKTNEPKESLELIKVEKKTKATAACTSAKSKKKKGSKEVDIGSEKEKKDALQPDAAIMPSSHSTPKRNNKNNNKKASASATVTSTATVAAATITTATTTTATISTTVAATQPTVDSEDDKTIEPKDEDTSTTLLSSVTATTTTATNKLHHHPHPHLDETDVANNNNECFEDNNQRQKQQEPLTLYKTPGIGWTTNSTSGRRGKRPKKVKVQLPNEIPRRTEQPRWSNGWEFEGEPYRALVFLNSDDPPVPRTCYDSMRHQECGDVIRPRDCVLLRAGGKRNELPYVAKVAQLFENPEDGEMMMSLFWYYRPEHTEQGRQSTDAIDEVFASRHKDHNSVACIEDKCYVITYNEYCRYRKTLKAAEENVEESVSVVPKLQTSERRTVPPNTSPELVMFCRRVYDFRGKRLMDDKKKK